MIKLPQKDNIWRGQYSNDQLGDFIQSLNIDLESRPGHIKPSERLRTVFTSSDDADLGLPFSFIKSSADSTSRYWAACGSVLFKSTDTDPEGAWAQDAIASTPTNVDSNSNFLEYNGDLFIAITSNIYRMSAGTWTANWWTATAGGSALQTSKKHILEITPVGDMAISDGKFVNTWDGSTATDPKLTLPSEYDITDMRRWGESLIIATKSLDNSDAKIFHWDGTSGTYNNFYSTGTKEVVSVFIHKNIPHIITVLGQIKIFDGTGYVSLGKKDGTELAFPSYKNFHTVSMNHDGIANIDGKTAIMIQTTGNIENGTSADEADGIWLYDYDTFTLHHKYSVSGQPHNSGGTNDYGHRYVNNVGAILNTARTSGKLLAGATVYSSYSGTTLKVILTSQERNTDNARGYFVTPKLYPKNPSAFFQKLEVIFRNLVNSTDKIIIKYRTEEDVTLPVIRATATIATGTTFTLSTVGGLTVGDEVEFITGNNAGLIAHITDITGTTVTIDETMIVTSGGSLCVFYNWTKLETINTQSINNKLLAIKKRGGWIQFKIELRGDEESPELAKLLLNLKEYKR